jgi:hypothetical protein
LYQFYNINNILIKEIQKQEARGFEMKHKLKIQELENTVVYLKNHVNNLSIQKKKKKQSNKIYFACSCCQIELMEGEYSKNLNKLRGDLLETQTMFENQRDTLMEKHNVQVRKLERRIAELEEKLKDEELKIQIQAEQIDRLRVRKIYDFL